MEVRRDGAPSSTGRGADGTGREDVTGEAALLSARNNAAQARGDHANALVQLYTALGGGWDASVTPQAPDPQRTTQDGIR